MPEKLRHAYDSLTGNKLPNKVPEVFFDIFLTLRKTPVQKKTERTPDPVAPSKATEAADTKKEK